MVIESISQKGEGSRGGGIVCTSLWESEQGYSPFERKEEKSQEKGRRE